MYEGLTHFALFSCPSTPRGLEDVSKYPNLFTKLLEDARWSVDDLKKLAGLNFLRVFRQVELVSIEKLSVLVLVLVLVPDLATRCRNDKVSAIIQSSSSQFLSAAQHNAGACAGPQNFVMSLSLLRDDMATTTTTNIKSSRSRAQKVL